MNGLLEEVLEVIDEMFYNNEKITYYSVSEKALVARKTLYNHPEIKEKIKYYKKFNSLSIDERINLVKEENRQLKDSIEKYENLAIEQLIKNQKSTSLP